MKTQKCTKGCGRQATKLVDFEEGQELEPRCGYHARRRCGGLVYELNEVEN